MVRIQIRCNMLVWSALKGRKAEPENCFSSSVHILFEVTWAFGKMCGIWQLLKLLPTTGSEQDHVCLFSFEISPRNGQEMRPIWHG